MSERVYIFDVDNTLTPPTRRMSRQFLMRFINWAKNKNIYIVCGGTYDKVKTQLPRSVVKTFSGMFFCMGNELRVKNEIKYQKEFKPSKPLINFLNKELSKNSYNNNLGGEIELRVGFINFSFLGKTDDPKLRKKYYYWDKKKRQRASFCKRLERKFPQLQCRMGGEKSIDIMPTHMDKSQSLIYIRDNHPNASLHFVGDKCFKGGNDFDIAENIMRVGDGKFYQVKNQYETLELLSYI